MSEYDEYKRVNEVVNCMFVVKECADETIKLSLDFKKFYFIILQTFLD